MITYTQTHGKMPLTNHAKSILSITSLCLPHSFTSAT